MKFARIVFGVAGVWGLLVLTPLYFAFDALGRQVPPPITHPEFYFGFIAVTLVWQVAFLIIASDPRRLRPIMIPAVLEKMTYVSTVAVLYLQGRLSFGQTIFSVTDLILGVLFVAAFFKTSGS